MAVANSSLRFGVDSGAAVTIMRKTECVDYPVDGSGSPVHYTCADGGRISDMGQRTLAIQTDEGVRLMRTRDGDISKNLLSVSSLVDTGHRVVFDADGSYAEHKTSGRRISFARRNGIYELDLTVLPFSQSPRAVEHPPV